MLDNLDLTNLEDTSLVVDPDDPDPNNESVLKKVPLVLSSTITSCDLNNLELTIKADNCCSPVKRLDYSLDSELANSTKYIDNVELAISTFNFTIDLSGLDYFPGSSHEIFFSLSNEIGSSIEQKVSFTLPQSFPEPVKWVKLKYDSEDLWNKVFSFDFEDPDNWGYWKNFERGYGFIWVLDGETRIETYPINTKKIYLDKSISHNVKKVQLCIRTWVTDNFGRIITSTTDAYSNSISIENKKVGYIPVKIYIREKNKYKPVFLVKGRS